MEQRSKGEREQGNEREPEKKGRRKERREEENIKFLLKSLKTNLLKLLVALTRT
jgi:hypothetical protein